MFQDPIADVTRLLGYWELNLDRICCSVLRDRFNSFFVRISAFWLFVKHSSGWTIELEALMFLTYLAMICPMVWEADYE